MLQELLTRGELKTLRDAAATEDDRRAIEDYWDRERPMGSAVKPLDQYARPIRVPRLAVEQAGRWSLLEPEELDCFAWNLDECDPALTPRSSSRMFASAVRRPSTSAKRPKVTTAHWSRRLPATCGFASWS